MQPKHLVQPHDRLAIIFATEVLEPFESRAFLDDYLKGNLGPWWEFHHFLRSRLGVNQ